MPKLILQFHDQVIHECVLGLMATIGRLPDNTVVIDNPAVSGHHACIFRNGEQFVVEDLESKNGTFVNDKNVTRQPLRHGDVVRIGKHKLVFDQLAGGHPADPDDAEPSLSSLRDTVYLDTQNQRALLAKFREELRDARDRANAAAGARPASTHDAAAAAVPVKVAVLRVLAGRAEHPEYRLEAHTALIGRSTEALVRLQGWFKPKVAVAIARHDDGYVATPFEGKSLINGQPLKGRHPLREGDILRVSGLILEFHLIG
jgi:pSer/pThr/pTyr-binding forkhead associated (FHA) protein